jgi:hypothetical protein
MILRLLNIQGIAGIAVSLALGLLLLIQKGETRHWKKESAGFEQLYHREQTAFATTVTNYHAAAEQARAADRANAARVADEQRTINERTTHDFEARLAAARADARRLRIDAQAAADSSPRGGAPMSGVPAPARGAAEAAGEDRLSPSDALTATEQAIQLDELVKWAIKQHEVSLKHSPAPPDEVQRSSVPAFPPQLLDASATQPPWGGAQTVAPQSMSRRSSHPEP